MRDLSRFLENPFDDDDISLAELLAFSTDHLHRLIAQSGGGSELAANIVNLTSALGVVEDKATNDTVKLGLRKARVDAKDDFRKALPGQIEKLAAAVTAQFGADSMQYLECFPEGREVYQKCRDDQLKIKLEGLVTALTVHQSALGAAVITHATGIASAWDAVFDASKSSRGTKKATETELRLARQNLQLMLYLNLLKLAEMFPRQPEKLALYMRQSLLKNPQSQEEEEPPPSP